MQIRDGSDLKRARMALGWSIYRLADELRLGGDSGSAARRIREMEAGTRDVTGPISVAVEGFLREQAGH